MLVGLIWLLVYGLVIAVVCYIVARLLAQFLPAATAYVWIVWVIGGLIWLILAIRLLSGVVPGP